MDFRYIKTGLRVAPFLYHIFYLFIEGRKKVGVQVMVMVS